MLLAYGKYLNCNQPNHELSVVLHQASIIKNLFTYKLSMAQGISCETAIYLLVYLSIAQDLNCEQPNYLLAQHCTRPQLWASNLHTILV